MRFDSTFHTFWIKKGMNAMSDMQAFRARLIRLDDECDPLLESLSRLTEATATQLQALWTEPGWGDWAAETPQLPSGRVP